ncbi:MAG TPA: ABC transporter permease [Gemmatimonadaceae bacterium]|nr:ABC transporter permease [Gemmatimonadaceae bacterium]
MSRTLRLARDVGASLRANRARSLLMMAGVAVAVAVLSTVIMIGQGTRARILDTVQKHGLDMMMVRAGGDVQVFAPRADRGLASLLEEDARAIRSTVPNIALVSAVQNQRGITVVAGERSVLTRAFGVESDWIEIRRWGMADGEFLSAEDQAAMARVVMLGARVARELFPAGGAVGNTIRVNGDPYVVKGVFIEMGASAGGDDWDDRIVVPFTTSSRRLFGRPYLEQVVVRVRDARRMDETADAVRGLLRVRHGIASGAPDDFFVREPEDVEGAALETSTTLTSLLIGIAIVALVAGGVVIMNLMLLSVAQRTHEIGLRRAIGARRGDITLQFVLESLGIALGGGVLGIGIGAAVAAGIAALDVAAVDVTWIPFAAALIACTALGLLFGIPPARRAAALDPATSLGERRL